MIFSFFEILSIGLSESYVCTRILPTNLYYALNRRIKFYRNNNTNH